MNAPTYLKRMKYCRNMKVGFLQFNPAFGKVDENLKKVKALINASTCDLLVLPELFTTGYTFKTKTEVTKFGESVPNGKTAKFLKRISTEKKMSIVGGFVERDGKKVYNSSFLFLENGRHYVYRKKHLYRYEKRLFDTAYEPYRVFLLKNGVKVGLIICFDWLFPEAIRRLALLGAQIICHPANLVMSYCQDAMITRALENRVFIITANRTGTEKRGRFENRFTGMSQIISPEGRILLRAGEDNEIASVVTINTVAALNKFLNPLNNIFEDRRKDLY